MSLLLLLLFVFVFVFVDFGGEEPAAISRDVIFGVHDFGLVVLAFDFGFAFDFGSDQLYHVYLYH